MLKEAMDIKQQIKADYEHLHACPEVGFELTETRAYVKKRLLEMGYQPIDCGKAGIVAAAGNADTGKSFLLRADMDALRIKEEADVPYKSTNGNMHACGHDAHTAMLLGAAKIIKYHEQELGGIVKFMFQPAEDTFEGAANMLQHGILENPQVDAALGFHVAAGQMPVGIFMYNDSGAMMFSSDGFRIHVKGKGSHGAYPQNSIDPINIACHTRSNACACEQSAARNRFVQTESIPKNSTEKPNR